MRKNNKNVSGFTLVETLIYMALIGATLSSFISFGLSIAGLRNKTYAMEEVASNSQFATGFIAREIRLAKKVLVPPKGGTSSDLSLEMKDGSTISFAIDPSSGIFNMTDGAGTVTAISSDRVTYPRLSFINMAEGNGQDSIRIEMTTAFKNEAGSIDFDYSTDMETAVNTRNSL